MTAAPRSTKGRRSGTTCCVSQSLTVRNTKSACSIEVTRSTTVTLRKGNVPQWADHVKTMRPHSFEVCTSGNKGDVPGCSCQPGAEIPSDASRSENHNLG